MTWSSRVNITRQTQKPCREDASGKIRDTIADGHWGWTGLGHGARHCQTASTTHGLYSVLVIKHPTESPTRTSFIQMMTRPMGDWWQSQYQKLRSDRSRAPKREIMLNARSTGGSTNRIVGLSRDGGESFYSTVEDKNLIEPGCQGSLLRTAIAFYFRTRSIPKIKERDRKA